MPPGPCRVFNRPTDWMSHSSCRSDGALANSRGAGSRRRNCSGERHTRPAEAQCARRRTPLRAEAIRSRNARVCAVELEGKDETDLYAGTFEAWPGHVEELL